MRRKCVDLWHSFFRAMFVRVFSGLRQWMPGAFKVQLQMVDTSAKYKLSVSYGCGLRAPTHSSYSSMRAADLEREPTCAPDVVSAYSHLC